MNAGWRRRFPCSYRRNVSDAAARMEYIGVPDVVCQGAAAILEAPMDAPARSASTTPFARCQSHVACTTFTLARGSAMTTEFVEFLVEAKRGTRTHLKGMTLPWCRPCPVRSSSSTACWHG